MKVKDSIIAQINNPRSRTKIATILGVGEQTIASTIRRNLPNGRLTKMDALKAISEVSGTAIEDILEESAVIAEK